LVCVAILFEASGFSLQGLRPDSSSIPVFTVTDFSKPFPPASLSNGFIGIRSAANPLISSSLLNSNRPRRIGVHPWATVVGGFVRTEPNLGGEAMAPAPYPLSTDIIYAGVSLSEHPEDLGIHRQSLDLSNGELVTEMAFRPSAEQRLDITVEQFASRSVPALLCQQITLRSSSPASILVKTNIDRTGIPGTVYADKAPYAEQLSDRVMGFDNGRTKLGIALVVPDTDGFKRETVGEYKVDAAEGKTYRFQTVAAMVSELYASDPELEAIRLVGWAKMLGFDHLRAENRGVWRDLWKGRLLVDGDPEAQRALDTAFFYLISNSSPLSMTGTPPFGFSEHEAYGGHIFWDMDSFMVPPLTVLAPQIAKAMLEFRLRGLAEVQKRARLFGFQGAMYPWEAGINGTDATPSGADTGWAEQHISADIAIAFWEYQVATGDKEFLRNSAWPVLRNVAEWIASRGTFTKRGFEIQNLMGVDESVGSVSNGSQMNLACKMVMRAALDVSSKLGISVPPTWRKIADTIVIPRDLKTGVVLPYDGAKPGSGYSVDMLPLLFLHNLPVDPEEFRRTFTFEQKLKATVPSTPSVPCTKESPGFSCPPVAASEAFIGDRKRAKEYFERSWKEYWVEPYGLTKEYAKYEDGNYITNDGSLLMSVIFGFTGLRISDGDWHHYPATLPEGWKRIEIERIWIHGKPMHLIAENGKPAQLLEGN
jgi:trehalose/maltose hydrolase-like predicted phosphorylase